jgi:hypothetical protein
MHDLRKDFGFPFRDDDDKPGQKLDGRTRDGRLIRDTRNALLAEFPCADQLRLNEATTLSIAIARLQPQVLAGDGAAIGTLASLSNRLQCLGRELRAAAKEREAAR